MIAGAIIIIAAGRVVVMSVVRKYSFESEDGQQVQRSQSSVLVHDGDQMHVIEGPARVTVSQSGQCTRRGGGVLKGRGTKEDG